MPGANVGPIFKGLTPSNGRKAILALAKEHKGKFSSFHLPCAGSFSIAEAMADAGVDPKRIHASDIALFTSVVGYFLDPDKDPSELGFEAKSEALIAVYAALPKETKAQRSAAIMVAQKYTQMFANSYYGQWLQKQFSASAPDMQKQYMAALEKMAGKLGGMHYEIKDAHAHLDSIAGDKGAFAYYNPPGYKGGYTKMYDPKGHFVWGEPHIPELDMDGVAAYCAKLPDFQCTVAVWTEDWYRTSQKVHPIDFTKFELYFCAPNTKLTRTYYIVLNKVLPETDDVVFRPKIRKPPKKIIKVFDDHEITPNSRLSMHKVDMDTALYYYDLFVRELGMVKSRAYYLFTVDGQVTGTVGFDASHAMMKRHGIVFETFGLTLTSERYARINRLLMRYITSRVFMDQFEKREIPPHMFLPKMRALRTTCLSKYPEVKVNRGLLELINKEVLPNGRYKLLYQADIHDMSEEQMLGEWITKHSMYSRTKTEAA